jgi:hypothetical protein
MNDPRPPILLVLLLLFAAVPASASARTKAPAAVRVTATAHAHPGGHLLLSASARKPVKLRIALSADRRLGAGDVTLTSRLVLRAPHRRHGGKAPRATAERLLSVPATVAAGKYRLLACAGKGAKHCGAARGSVVVSTTPVATSDLVQTALAAHRISPGRALIFRIWAQFGNDKLPAAYRGDADPATPDDSALREALAYRSHMSRTERAQLAPYLLPPNAPGSWLFPHVRPKRAKRSKAAAAKTVDRACQAQETTEHWGALTGTHVRVWWWRDHTRNRDAARKLVSAADKTVWPAFQKLMGRTPLSDAGKRCNGGDAKYDIYLLPSDLLAYGTLRGATLPYGPHCSASPSFTMIDTHGGFDPPTRFELAHELFHAFQFAFAYQGDCAVYKEHLWFDEGSAVWASTRVYPHEEGNHGESDLLLESLCAPLTYYKYDSFPFVLQIAERDGEATIPAIYRAFAGADTLNGIDATLPGGFAKAWKSFTTDGWNREAVGSPFASWYGLKTSPELQGDFGITLAPNPLDLHGQHGYRTLMSLKCYGSLQRSYHYVSPGPGVKQITVHNHTAGDGVSDLQAFLLLPDDTWQTIDLSATRDRTFCLAQPGQRFKAIALAYDNHGLGTGIVGAGLDEHGPPDEFDKTLTVDARDSCARYFKVTAASGSLQYTAHYPANRYAGDTCVVDGSETDQLTFDPAGSTDATDGHYDDGAAVLQIPLHVHGSADYHSSPCQAGGGDGGTDSCHVDIDDDGGMLATALGDAAAPTVDLQLGANRPRDLFCSGRFADAGVSADLDPRVISSDVPVGALSGDAPFTVSWTSTAGDAQHAITRKLTATLQPVSQDGSPLGAGSSAVQGPLP